MKRSISLQEIALALLFIVPLVVFASHLWPVADDFLYKAEIRRQGAWAFFGWHYLHWSGRAVVFTPIILWTYWMPLFIAPLLSSGLAILFWATSRVWVSALFATPSQSPTSSTGTVATWYAGLATAALWFILSPIMGQCVFWMIGGFVYGGALAVSVIWIVILFRNPATLQLVLLSMVVGALQEQLSAAAFGFLFVRGVLGWHGWTVLERRRFGLVALGLLLGAAVLYGSPGNFERAAFGGAPAHLDVFRTLRITTHLIPYYIRLGGWMWPVGMALVGFAMSRTALPWAALVPWWAWWLGAFLSAFPAALVPTNIEPRTAFFFLFFGFVGGTSGLAGFFRGRGDQNAGMRIAANGLSTALAVALLASATRETFQARAISAQIHTRDHVITEARSRGVADVTVLPVEGVVPGHAHFDDLREDSSYWVNRAQAFYYQVRSIRTAPRADR